jgi:hypothetical protein
MTGDHSRLQSRSVVRIVTDSGGCIVDTCGDSPRALNVSARGLTGRRLALFFPGDRPQLLAKLALAARGDEVELTTVLQPRERKPRPAQVLLRQCDDHGQAAVEWVIVLG